MRSSMVVHLLVEVAPERLVLGGFRLPNEVGPRTQIKRGVDALSFAGDKERLRDLILMSGGQRRMELSLQPSWA